MIASPDILHFLFPLIKYFMFHSHLTPGSKWAWPVWGGLVMMVSVVPLWLIVIAIFEPFSKRHKEREEARRRQREELLASNRPLAQMPAVALPTVPQTAAMANGRLGAANDQGALKS
ncbi:hypothetical protein DL93DRAFT_2074817 [Clavulina sp. PMI_390]|nr:hypothetical protein DL93DRAFT_2074817 [Clavulina sp. PMI_390]